MGLLMHSNKTDEETMAWFCVAFLIAPNAEYREYEEYEECEEYEDSKNTRIGTICVFYYD